MADVSGLKFSATDWRQQLQKNRRRTRFVIIMFLALYIGLGVIIDCYLYNYFTHLPVSTILRAILAGEYFPFATISMGAVAALSLFVTYTFYDKLMLLGTDAHEVTPETARNLQEKQLFNVVEEMKVAAGLRYMPKVYIIDANYMNAFATGYSEKSALVAITRALMERLDRSEMQAVMAHELSHIRHQDIRLTLTASVLSNIMLIVIDIIFYNILFSRNRKVDARVIFVVMILRYVLPLITMLLMFYLSRTREYMADAGSVELMRDNQPLARALLKIHQQHQTEHDALSQEYGHTAHENVRRASYLYDPVSAGTEPVFSFTNMFSTHPGLQERLNAIGVSLKDEA